MAEIKIGGIPNSWARNARIFTLGLVWTCAGGLAPATTALGYALWKWRDYPIDWEQIGAMALSGAGPLAIAYWRKHKALLTPLSMVDEFAQARKMVEEDAAQGKTTTVEKTETLIVTTAPAVAALAPNPTQPPAQP